LQKLKVAVFDKLNDLERQKELFECLAFATARIP